jgi:hypothetical protein
LQFTGQRADEFNQSLPELVLWQCQLQKICSKYEIGGLPKVKSNPLLLKSRMTTLCGLKAYQAALTHTTIQLVLIAYKLYQLHHTYIFLFEMMQGMCWLNSLWLLHPQAFTDDAHVARTVSYPSSIGEERSAIDGELNLQPAACTQFTLS